MIIDDDDDLRNALTFIMTRTDTRSQRSATRAGRSSPSTPVRCRFSSCWI
jgi:hypothetical protein